MYAVKRHGYCLVPPPANPGTAGAKEMSHQKSHEDGVDSCTK